MSQKLRIILIEDCAADAELVEMELRRGGLALNYRVVQTEAQLVRAFKEGLPDIVLCDCGMPGIAALEALDLLRKESLEIPFIAISGNIREDEVAELIKRGASDFVSKSSLSRLATVMKRAMDELEHQRRKRRAETALRDSESRFRAVFEGAGTGIAVEDLQGRIIETNRALQQMLGYTADELQALT